MARELVALIYEHKLLADGVDDARNNRREDMPSFLAEWFLHRYGLASLSRKNSQMLEEAVLLYSQPNSCHIEGWAVRYDRRLRLFGKLAAIGPQVPEN